MPTGYTHAVQSGETTDFQEFALECAKAFGACVTMRDEPTGTPIPDEFEASTSYHDKALEAAMQVMVDMGLTSDELCEKNAQVKFDAEVKSHEERAAEREDQRLRYQQMLEKAEAWRPPTSDHAELKNFMIKQLTESIEFDCGGKDYYTYPDQETGKQWRERTLAKAERDVSYHTEERDKELERTATRNKWVSDLRGSFTVLVGQTDGG